MLNKNMVDTKWYMIDTKNRKLARNNKSFQMFATTLLEYY